MAMTGDRNAAWTVETLNETVDAEIESLPDDMRADFVRISGMIEARGLQSMGMPHVRHLEGPLWEMRLRGRDGISRTMYARYSADGSWWYGCLSRKLKGRHVGKYD